MQVSWKQKYNKHDRQQLEKIEAKNSESKTPIWAACRSQAAELTPHAGQSLQGGSAARPAAQAPKAAARLDVEPRELQKKSRPELRWF